MQWYIKVMKQYAKFSGRACRSEYWWFVLVNFIISFLLGAAEGFFGAISGKEISILTSVYSLIVLLPSLGVSLRRFHDVEKSGWILLLPLAGIVLFFNIMLMSVVTIGIAVYLIYLLAKPGTKGPNKYGEDPLQEASGEAQPYVIPDVPETGNRDSAASERKYYCRNCGAELKYSDSKFCSHCGASLAEDNENKSSEEDVKQDSNE